MKPLRFGASLVYLLLAAGAVVHAQAKLSSDSDVVIIDGAKNPADVPNWAAWLEGFRLMAGPAAPEEPIPSVIYVITTKEQHALIRKEALFVMAEERRLGELALKLQDGLTSDNFKQRSAKADALEMQRRRAALDARDRLLAAIPQAQFAFLQFADEMRKGYKARVVKAQLAQFMAPE